MRNITSMLLIYYHNGIVNTCITCGEHWLNMWLTGQDRHPVVRKRFSDTVH